MNSWQDRIEKLSVAQRKLLGQQIAEYVDRRRPMGTPEQKELVAYVIATKSLDKESLKSYLRSRLPAYMVPAQIVRLDAFPKLPNGKIHIRALPAPQKEVAASSDSLIAPEGALEVALWEIWQEVLKVEQLGVKDNFFEIGGDSIMSIQIVAKARKKGIRIAPPLIFEHQSIRELAAVLSFEETSEPKQEEAPLLSGEIPLLPIQYWFLKHFQKAPQHWNQVMHYQRKAIYSEAALQDSLSWIAQQHDALRTRFYLENGQWKAQIVSPAEMPDLQVQVVPIKDEAETILQLAKPYQEKFDLERGPLLQVLYLPDEAQKVYHLLFVVHHLLIDAVSWGILEEDFIKAYTHYEQKQSLAASPKTSSIAQWGHYLSQELAPQIVKPEIDFWNSQVNTQVDFPTDRPSPKPYSEQNAQTVRVRVSREDTISLLREVPQNYPIRIQELLLIAWANALYRWRKIPEVIVNLEGHGREVGRSGLDLSETLGWFTNMYPLRLLLNPQDSDPYLLKSLKEQIHQVPAQGLGFGALAYLSEKYPQFREYHPQVIFNYLGQEKSEEQKLLGQQQMLWEGSRHPKSERFHELEINARVTEEALDIALSYSTEVFDAKSIKDLAGLYQKLIPEIAQYCLESQDEGYTPSDFPEAGLNQEDLDNLLGQIN